MIDAAAGHADPVAVPDHRREVADEEQEILGVPRPAQKRDHARVPVMAIDPLEPAGCEIRLVESRVRPVEPVQILDQSPETSMVRPHLE